jgi:hypothetical protein
MEFNIPAGSGKFITVSYFKIKSNQEESGVT